MNIRIIFLSVFAGMLLLASCKKGNTGSAAVQTPFSYDSLISERYAIYILTNPSAKITAYAKGDGLTYQWKATAGDILGNGNQVTYTGNPSCCGGNQVITCIVRDNHSNVKAKNVSIYVNY